MILDDGSLLLVLNSHYFGALRGRLNFSTRHMGPSLQRHFFLIFIYIFIFLFFLLLLLVLLFLLLLLLLYFFFYLFIDLIIDLIIHSVLLFYIDRS